LTQEHVQGSVELPRDLEGDRNAAARQPEHHDAVEPGIAAQPLGEQPAGVGSIAETLMRCGHHDRR
jgi:hypothetical protein